MQSLYTYQVAVIPSVNARKLHSASSLCQRCGQSAPVIFGQLAHVETFGQNYYGGSFCKLQLPLIASFSYLFSGHSPLQKPQSLSSPRGGVETGRSTDDAMHGVALLQQKFSQVGAILPSQAFEKHLGTSTCFFDVGLKMFEGK